MRVAIRRSGLLSPPPFLDPAQAAGDRLQPRVQPQPRGRQRRPAVVGERRADGRAVAANRLGLGIVAPLDRALDRADAADLLLELLLGVAVGLEDRQGRLAQVVEVAELVRHVGQALLDGAANRVLAVAHDTGDRHADRGRDLAQQPGEVGRDGREQRAGEQDPAGQAVTDDPQDLMTDVGLQAVEREHDPPLDGQGGAPRLVHHCRDQLVVTVEQVGHRALAHRHAALPQGMMDLRHAAVLAVAQGPDQGDHVEAELVLRQRDGAFGFGPVGPVVAGTAGRLATSDLQAQAHRPV